MSIIKNEKTKKFTKNFCIFIFVFLLVLCFLMIFGFANNYGDPINNYLFAYGFYNGQIPYVDFNLITTPLYAMYQSLFLYVYNDFIMILVSQALIVTMTFFLLYKLFGKKSILFLLVTVVCQYKNIVATYNYMCFFMMVILIYLEKRYPSKDLLIGLVIGLAILSKHTTGLFMIIPSLVFYFKDLKRLLKRTCGVLIPCFIFLIYLLCNGALYEFIDLAFLGLFDFSTNNGVGGGHYNYLWIILSILILLIIIGMIIKNKKDINLYYFIFGFVFVFPLFDATHFAMWLNCFMICLLPYIKFSDRLITTVVFAVSIPVLLIFTYIWNFRVDLTFTKKLDHFKYSLHNKSNYKSLCDLNDYVNTYDDAIVIGYFSMTHTLINEREASYFDVLYNGNFGYNGNQKMINKIENMHEQYFLVSMTDYNSNNEFSQISKEVMKYIMDNCEKVESKYIFDVYYKE